MREERGQIAGPLVVHEKYTLWGSVGGDVIVVEGGKFYMRGSIYGNLTVEYGGRAHVFGSITGDLKIARGAKVIHSGVIAGDATNEGGRLFVDATAKIEGKVKTLKGETKIEPPPTVPGASPPRQRNRLRSALSLAELLSAARAKRRPICCCETGGSSMSFRARLKTATSRFFRAELPESGADIRRRKRSIWPGRSSLPA